jgi:hypothetical protein
MTSLPHTFRGLGHEVTVNADRSIRVKAGDSLSKYSLAIWGDIRHQDFETKVANGIYQERDPRIPLKTGEILYAMHELPYEDGYIGPPSFQKISQFFELMQYLFRPTGWRVETPPGRDFDVSFFDGGGGPIDVKGYNPAGGPQTLRLVCAANEKKLIDIGNPNDQHPIIMCDNWWPAVLYTPGSILCDNLSVDRLYGRILAIEAGISLAKFADGSSVTAIIFNVWDQSPLLDSLSKCFSDGKFNLLHSLLVQARTPIALVPGRRPVGSIGLEARRGICVGRP